MVTPTIGDWVFICNPLRRIRTGRTISAGAELVTLFLVDEENDFYMIFMEQKRGGSAPFNNNVSGVYEVRQAPMLHR